MLLHIKPRETAVPSYSKAPVVRLLDSDQRVTHKHKANNANAMTKPTPTPQHSDSDEFDSDDEIKDYEEVAPQSGNAKTEPQGSTKQSQSKSSDKDKTNGKKRTNPSTTPKSAPPPRSQKRNIKEAFAKTTTVTPVKQSQPQPQLQPSEPPLPQMNGDKQDAVSLNEGIQTQRSPGVVGNTHAVQVGPSQPKEEKKEKLGFDFFLRMASNR